MTKAELRGFLTTYLPENAGERHSGFSFRAGGATDLFESATCKEETIKRQGRWKSEAFRLYIRHHPHPIVEEVRVAFTSMMGVEEQPGHANRLTRSTREIGADGSLVTPMADTGGSKHN
jgi:hypothetical protein